MAHTKLEIGYWVLNLGCSPIVPLQSLSHAHDWIFNIAKPSVKFDYRSVLLSNLQIHFWASEIQ